MNHETEQFGNRGFEIGYRSFRFKTQSSKCSGKCA